MVHNSKTFLVCFWFSLALSLTLPLFHFSPSLLAHAFRCVWCCVWPTSLLLLVDSNITHQGILVLQALLSPIQAFSYPYSWGKHFQFFSSLLRFQVNFGYASNSSLLISLFSKSLLFRDDHMCMNFCFILWKWIWEACLWRTKIMLVWARAELEELHHWYRVWGIYEHCYI